MHATLPQPLSGQPKALLWAPEYEIEPAALAQIRLMSEQEAVIGVRIMPDVHVGKGAVVGSVFATRDAVSPEAVGTDLGCGVVAVKTGLSIESLTDLAKLRANIESRIPVGFASHASPVDMNKVPLYPMFLGAAENSAAKKLWAETDLIADGKFTATARKQFATLGGGNHFAEVCSDSEGTLWVQLHSGSRGAGKAIAEHHIAKLKGKGQMRMLENIELENYMRDLKWALEYAHLSRRVMVANMLKSIEIATGAKVRTLDVIECIHNYVAVEEMDGTKTFITRKGAISAKEGERGIIPASMANGSYIVEGKGDPRSYFSASHGAGRKFSRGKAKELFKLEDLREQTRAVECRKDMGVLDELPAAYKNIEDVMSNQGDLVAPVERLETLICVKG